MVVSMKVHFGENNLMSPNLIYDVYQRNICNPFIGYLKFTL